MLHKQSLLQTFHRYSQLACTHARKEKVDLFKQQSFYIHCFVKSYQKSNTIKRVLSKHLIQSLSLHFMPIFYRTRFSFGSWPLCQSVFCYETSSESRIMALNTTNDSTSFVLKMNGWFDIDKWVQSFNHSNIAHGLNDVNGNDFGEWVLERGWQGRGGL